MFKQRVITLCSLLFCFISSCTSEESTNTIIIEGKEAIYTTCSNVSLTCRISPSIENIESVSWYVNNTNITIGNRISAELKDCTSWSCAILHMKCVEETDSGNYSCRVSDSDGGEKASTNWFALNVQEPVLIVNSSEEVRIPSAPNANAELWCEFSGPNNYSISWSKKEGQDVIQLPASYYKQEKLENGHVLSKLTLRDIRDSKNGTYVCAVPDGPHKEVWLMVLSPPHLTLGKVIPTGAHTVFMNWTVNNGNVPISKYLVQMKKLMNGSDDWTYYSEEINKMNTSCILKNLEPSTTYQFKMEAHNSQGSSAPEISPPVTTFDYDPNFTPDVTIKGSSPHSINIGWNIPQNEMKKDVHFYKLMMRNKSATKETIVDSEFSYAFQNLESATNYSFQVVACNKYTNECGNWSKVVNGTTLDGEAGPPENVSMSCKFDNISHTSMVFVSWSPPKNPNGEIDHYNVVIHGNAYYINENGESSYMTFGPKSTTIKSDTNSTFFDKLSPNTNYTISVSAVTRSRGSGTPASRECVMPPTVPDRENLKFDWDKVEEKGQWYFKLLKPKLSERNGAICCFRVFIVKLKPQQSLEQLDPPEEIPIASYDFVHKYANSVAYIADIFDKDAIHREIMLGDNQFSVNYNNSKCNKCPFIATKIVRPTTTTTSTTMSTVAVSEVAESTETSSSSPNAYSHYASEKFMADSVNMVTTNESEMSPYDGSLDMNSNYTGFIQIMVDGKDKYIPAYSGYFRILRPGPQALESSQATELASILFQILCGMIVISIMMLAAFCLLQHYTKQVAEAQGVEMTLRNSFRHWCRSLRGSHLPVSSNPPDVLPISKTALLTAFAELAKDSDYGFEQEFEMLPDRFTDRTTKASEARENACKNRYPDIKAYDQTRVKLSQIDGIIGSDYINANFVISYKERKKFICAQGPMENTVCDFWRMIWEQHLELVLMLTNLEEYSKTKCAKYWPDKEEEKKTYADITIHYVNEKRYSDYVVRELKMVRVSGQNRDPEERNIFQYHFLMWKDFQAPEHPSGILKFIWRVNEAYSLEKGPILVHCSAGVGRTGTLVAIDSLLQQLDSEGQVLIFNTICDLRHQRNFLVQSLKQYIFVYRALVEYAQFGNTEIKAKNLKATVEKLKQCDNGKMKSRMEEEYEKLSFTVSTHDHKSSSVGTAPENAPKNRSTNIIPFDRNRVILTPVPGRDHSTYINASFMEGYDNSESFIITQDPIIDVTVADFWRMISEQNISTIVMLSSPSRDDQKKTGRYWPDDETVYGNINVKHIQSESCPYYTRREFYITHLKTDDNLVVTQYQYNGWPTVEGEVPEVTRGMIELMDHATQHSDTTGTAPIVVHCELGSDRSSMFVALCILAQQLKIERRVDVVTTARKLRSQRQGMLTAFAQYEFLYRAILNYVDLHHLSDSETE